MKRIKDLNHGSGKLGAYKALIIGINQYKDPRIADLKTAVNDAKAVADVLKNQYGFSTSLLLNEKANKSGIYKALRKLASESREQDSVLIYYAGHGDLDKLYDTGWWIPADARGGDPLTYLENNQIQKAMNRMKARHVLLVSDSCYSGTLFGRSRAMPPVITDTYYLNLYNEKSRWGMTSGNKTPVSDSGSGGHSVFAYQFLKELKKTDKSYFSTQELYTRIAPIIGNNSDQTPRCSPIRNTGDQGGEFVFVRVSGDVPHDPPTKRQPAPTPVYTLNAEEELWKEVSGSNSVDELQMYLDAYPQGRFVQLARLKMKRLDGEILQSLDSEDINLSATSGVSMRRLIVETTPSDAQIRILNISPKYKPNMLLSMGRYHLEVSAPGYKKEMRWVELQADEDLEVSFNLEKEEAPDFVIDNGKQPVLPPLPAAGDLFLSPNEMVCKAINRTTHPSGLNSAAFNCYTDNYWLGRHFGGDQKEQNFVRISKNTEGYSDEITITSVDDYLNVLV